MQFIEKANIKKDRNTKNNQTKQLFHLGLQHKVNRLNPNKLIFNYSRRSLSDDEINILSHGLRFALPPKTISYSKWFLAFEKLYLKLKKCPIYDATVDSLNIVRSNLKTISFKYYYNHKPKLNQMNQKFLRTLKTLR